MDGLFLWKWRWQPSLKNREWDQERGNRFKRRESQNRIFFPYTLKPIKSILTS